MATLIGVVSQVVGEVFAVASDGSRRPLIEGDRVYSGEQIVTGANGAVAVAMTNGQQLTLGRDSSLALNAQMLSEAGDSQAPTADNQQPPAPSDSDLSDVEQLQAAIEAGVDPTQEGEATAAGPGAGAGGAGGAGGGHSYVLLDAVGGALDPVIGFPTAGLAAGPEFPDGEVLNTADVPDGIPTGGNASAAVDEDGLPGGIAGGINDLDGESATVSGNLGYSFGPDGVGSFAWSTAGLVEAGIESRGVPLSYVVSPDGLTLSAYAGETLVFTVEVTNLATGDYSFTLYAPLDHEAPQALGGSDENDIFYQFGYTIIDGNGTTAGGSLAVRINDDSPAQNSGEDAPVVRGLVHEDALASVGNGEPGNSPAQTVNFRGEVGALDVLVNFGADGRGGFQLDTNPEALAGLQALGLTSGEIPLVYSVSPDGTTLTATAGEGGAPVFTLVVNADGSYEFTLQGPLDHPQQDGDDSETLGGSDIALDFSGLLIATDFDGDAIAGGFAPGSFVIDVEDDVPSLNQGERPTLGGLVHEDVLSGGNAESGQTLFVRGEAGALDALVNFGADGRGGFQLSTTPGALGSLQGLGLTSGGVALFYVVSTDGSTLTATAGQGGAPVFTLQVNSDGSYEFRLQGPVDHPVRDGNDGETLGDGGIALDFSSLLIATDGDGDPLPSGFPAGSLVIDIEDDVPTLNEGERPALGGTVHEDLLSGGNAESGQTLFVRGEAGALDALVNFGADGRGGFQLNTTPGALGSLQGLSLTSGGVALFYVVSTDGSTLTATAGQGGAPVFTLQVNTDGSYEFRLQGPIDHPVQDGDDSETLGGSGIVLDFSGLLIATDGDGDPLPGGFPAGSLVIDIEDDVPVLNGGERPALGGTVHEDLLSGGNAESDQRLTVSGDAGALDVLVDFGADGRGGFQLSTTPGSLGVLQGLGLASGGVPLFYVVSADGTTLTATAGEDGSPVFQLVVNVDGSYEFRLLGPIDHPLKNGDDTETLSDSAVALDFSSLLIATDGDGDPLPGGFPAGSFVIDVEDDVPTLAEGEGLNVRGTVHEDLLNGGNAETGQSLTASAPAGTLDALVNFGADGRGGFQLDTNPAALSTLQALGLTSGSVELFYVVSADGTTLTATADEGGAPVFELVVNTDGSYEFTLQGPLDHPQKDGDDSELLGGRALDFSGLLIATDGDGDPLPGGFLAGSFVIDVEDDVPTLAEGEGLNVRHTVHEDLLNGGNEETGQSLTASAPAGTLDALVNFGADGRGGFQLDTNPVALNTLKGLDLTSGGVVLFYVVSVDGSTLTATAGEGGAPVFKLVVSTDGSYEFTLQGPLDHPQQDGDDSELLGELALDFSSLLIATDGDGDPLPGGFPGGSFVIDVEDDVPTLSDPKQNPAIGGTVHEDLLFGPHVGNPDASGQALVIDSAGGAGNLSSLVSFGADGPGAFGLVDSTTAKALLDGQGLKSGGEPLNYAVSEVRGGDNNLLSTTLTATAADGYPVFTLKVNADGSFRFELQGPIDHPEKSGNDGELWSSATGTGIDFTQLITATDGDGDPLLMPEDAGGRFVINVEDDVPELVVNDSEYSLTLTFKGGDATMWNSYGYYVKNPDGTPASGEIIWGNTRLQANGSSITLEGLNPDDVGFFIIPNGGWGSGFGINGLPNGAQVSFELVNGQWKAVVDGKVINGDGGASVIFDNPQLNPDGKSHLQDNGAPGNQNWEDTNNGTSDNDYNDVNIQATWAPKTPAPIGGTVHEDLLSGGNAESGQTLVVSSGGSVAALTALVKFGADGPGSFGLVDTAKATELLNEQGLTSGDKPLVYEVTKGADGSTTLTATSADGNAIFTLVVKADGNYTFTLQGPIDHPLANGDDSELWSSDGAFGIDFTHLLNVTDGDGDPLTIPAGTKGLFAINIEDDVPTLSLGVNQQALGQLEVALDETRGTDDRYAANDDQSQGYTSDDIAGALGRATTQITGGLGSLFTIGGSAGADGQASLSHTFSFSGVPAQGLETTLTATEGGAIKLFVDPSDSSLVRGIDAAGDTVFTIAVVMVDGVAQLQTTLFEAIRHPGNNQSFDEALDLLIKGKGSLELQYQLTRTDGDGDSVTRTAKVDLANSKSSYFSFEDDGPQITKFEIKDGAKVYVDESVGTAGSSQNEPGQAAPNDEQGRGNVLGYVRVEGKDLLGFSADGGSDGLDASRTRFSLSLSANGVDSGLSATVGGNILLSKDSNGDILGRASNGTLVFKVSVNAADGSVTLEQYQAIKHGDTNSHDELATIKNGLLKLNVTVYDKDGDSQSASLDLGKVVGFEDDGPQITKFELKRGVKLFVDESVGTTGSSQNEQQGQVAPNDEQGHGNVLGYAKVEGKDLFQFNADGGSDGLDSSRTRYELNLSQDGVDSGLDATVGGNILLSKDADGNVLGIANDALVFKVSINTLTGSVTLEQYQAIKHDNTSNHDDLMKIADGVLKLGVTIYDKDGDSHSASLDLGKAVGFEDDGPWAGTTHAEYALDDEGLPNGINGGMGDVSGANTTVTGTLAFDAGSDGLRGIALSGPSQLGSESVTSTWNAATSTLTISSTRGPLVSVQLTNLATGAFKLDLLKPLMHPAGQDENNIKLDIRYTVTDGDGDTAQGTLKVTVNDDTPTIQAMQPGFESQATYLGTDADFNNSYGYYTRDDDGNPVAGKVIWANVHQQAIGTTFDLGGLDPSEVGFFIIPDGGKFTNGLSNGAEVTFLQGADGKWQALLNGTPLIGRGGADVLFDRAELNPGGSALQDNAFPGNQNWEDLASSPDYDYNDVSTNVTWGMPLQVDETNLGTPAAAASRDFSSAFNAEYGADGAGSLRYVLTLKSPDSGLRDTESGQAVKLSVNAQGVLEGRTEQGGQLVFTLAVDQTGVATLTQLRAVVHPTSQPDELNLLGAGKVELKATITDADGDQATASIDLGKVIGFRDDAPTAQADNFSGDISRTAVDKVIGNVSDLTANDSFGKDGKALTNALQIIGKGSQGGSLIIDADGSLRYTAGKGAHNGTETFTYRINDRDGDSATSTLTINLAGRDPVGGSTQAFVDEDGLSNGLAGGAGDIPGEATSATGPLGYAVDSFGGFAWNASALVGLKSAGSALSYSNSDSGKTLTAVDASGNKVFTLTLTNTATGEYRFDLFKPLDHAAPQTQGTASENNLPLNFTYKVWDASQPSAPASGSLTVNVNDDSPAQPNALSQSGPEPTAIHTNLMIVLDLSGSMDDSPNVAGFSSKLALAKSAIQNLINAYDGLGDVMVRLVTFNDGASSNLSGSGEFWLSAQTAKQVIGALADNYGDGYTNYDAALLKAISAFNSSGKLPVASDVQNVAYFLSDGQPNTSSNWPGVLGTGGNGINGSEEAAWINLLKNNDIKAYALGMGQGSQDDLKQLNPVAYDGTGAGTNTNGILVTNLNQLDSVLQGTVTAQTLSGNLISQGSNGFGADGPAELPVASIQHGGVTYGTGSAGYDSTTHLLTFTTAQGGNFSVNLKSGAYSYSLNKDVANDVTETFTYTLADKDGDQVSSTLQLTTTDSSEVSAYNNYNTKRDAEVRIDNIALATVAAVFVDKAGAGYGNVLTDPSHSGQIDSKGSEGAVLSIWNGSNFVEVAEKIAVPGDWGRLEINNTGAYTYTSVASHDAAGEEDEFLYRLTQPDGGMSEAKLVIATASDKSVSPVVPVTPDPVVGSEPPVENDSDSNVLLGTADDDRLEGSDAENVLIGGAGDDILIGGAGNDTFVWNAGDRGGNYQDIVKDFGKGDDRLDLSDLLTGVGPDADGDALSQYLSFDFTINPGSTVISVSSTGNISDPGSIDQTITLENAVVGGGLGNSTADIIDNMLSNQQLHV